MRSGTDGNLLNDYENALADLYIDHDIDRQMRGGITKDSSYYSANYRGTNPHWYWLRHLSYISPGYNIHTGHQGFVIDYTLTNELNNAATQAADRHYWWITARNRRREEARRNLAWKMRDTAEYRRYACSTVNENLFNYREAARVAIHTAIKRYGDPRKLTAGTPQMTNTLFSILGAINQQSYINMFQVFGRMKAADDASQVINLVLQNANKIGDEWMKPVWWREHWFKANPISYVHAVHVSEKNPELIAYTQSGDKLLKDVQTATRPGKYLMQFFGPDSEAPIKLSEQDVRDWANKQAAVNKTDDLTFVANTDPDGWEWVYENGSGFNSCMVYNHPSNRNLDHALHGENHPVRIYANKHNDLALTYIGDELKSTGGRVYGRAIVNTASKKWVRLYGDDRLKHVLTLHGYSLDSSCLDGQVLTCKEHNGQYIMPYLDGDVCRVRMSYKDGEYVFVVDEDGGYDAQNSNGLMGDAEDDTCECPCCGVRYDEDDLYYVECRGESICESCRDENYRYAYGRRGQDYYPADDCVECQSDGEWYVEAYASNRDVYQCQQSDEWYDINDLVTLTAGEQEGDMVHVDYAKQLSDDTWCLEDEYEELQAALDAEDEEETSNTEDFPCAPVINEQPTTMTQPHIVPGYVTDVSIAA